MLNNQLPEDAEERLEDHYVEFYWRETPPPDYLTWMAKWRRIKFAVIGALIILASFLALYFTEPRIH